MTESNKRRVSNIVYTPANDVVSSDNTRVVLPYRVGEPYRRINLLRENPKESFEAKKEARRREIEKEEERARREKEEAERIKAEKVARDAERKRIDLNVEYYKKQQELRQKQYIEQKDQIAAQSALEEQLKDQTYESNYNWWKDDVINNPDNYNFATRAAVQASKFGPEWDAMSRILFNLKDMAGTVSYSSIDTNGTRYQGAISLRQHALDAARVHQNMIDLQQYRQNLSEMLSECMPGSKEYLDIQKTLYEVDNKLNDPELKQFDDDYKQNYVINKSGMWDTMKKAWRNYMSGYTYDQYKDYVAQRNYLQDVDQYYNVLVENRNDAQKDSRGADFLYQKVNPYSWGQQRQVAPTKQLPQYSTKDLLALDKESTKRRIDNLNEELGAYGDLYVQNRQHLSDSEKYWQVSESFKHGVEAHKNDALSAIGYWTHGIWPMVGSTFSSPEQLVSTAGQIGSVAGYASTPYTGGVGSLVGAGLAIGAGYYGIQSGFAENQTEAGDKRIDNFKNILKQSNNFGNTISELKDRSRHYWRKQGWSEDKINSYLDGEVGTNHAINDWFVGITKSLVDDNGQPYVFDKNTGEPIYTKPIANPAVILADLYSTQGLQALYEADNARTVFSNMFLTAAAVFPIKPFVRGASVRIEKNIDDSFSRYIGKEAEYITAADASGRVTARAVEGQAAGQAMRQATSTTYSNGFAKSTLSQSMKKGFERGAAAGEMAGFGVVGELVGGSAGALTNATIKLGVEKLPLTTRNLFRSIEEKAIHKYQGFYDKILPTSNFGRAAAIYGARTARNASASMMSEAAEEAVQYLNSKEDFASKYGWGGMSIPDMIFNDVYQGARVFNSYGALLGITESDLLNDAEYWANVQGGFALGGLHTGTIRLGVEGYNAYREVPIYGSILETAVMNRELDKKDRAANVEFARLAMRNRSSETLDVLDWMERNDSRRETPMFTKEDYAEKRKAAERVGQMVNNKTIRAKLEAKGFVYGTEEYANAIADLYSIEDARRQNREEAKEKLNSINGFYNTEEYQREADAIVQNQFDNDFEETIGRLAAIIEAGNKAVSEEIQRAKNAGEDTSTSEFKKHLLSIRTDAQEKADQMLKMQYRNAVLETSHVAHKLRSLIKLRAQHNTISDFFKYVQDKFNLKPKRGDASLIVQNIDSLIKQAKDQLHQLYEEFDTELSDKAVLDFIEQLPIVTAHSEDIESREIAAAMILADAAIISKHGQMFEEGLIQTPDGKWQYNPKEYKSRKSYRDSLYKKLTDKEITPEQFAEQIGNMPAAEPYDESAVKNNPYARRIKAIIDARKDDDSLEHMMNDIEYGDGVVKILNNLEKEEAKDVASDEAKERARRKSETFVFEQNENTAEQTVADVINAQPSKQQTQSAKEKYESRKKRANENYRKRKKSLRDLRKKAFATIVPIPTPLLNIANYLITKGLIGVYKIMQFAEELKAIAQAKGFNANEFLSGIKAFYIDKVVEAITENPELVENFSDTSEIVSFNFKDNLIIPQPVVVGPILAMQDLINAETAKINKTLSTHYDIIVNVDDTVAVYPNKESIVNARFETNYMWQDIVEKLSGKIDDEDSFRKYITELFANYKDTPIEDYIKHRRVENMIQAIANRRCNQEYEEAVQNGKRIRNAVVCIMLNREEQIDKNYFLGDFDAFRNQILTLKEQLTSKTNGKGLTILDTSVSIYGTDYNGTKMSSEADIIVTDGTDIYIIDVRYSFVSPRNYWSIKFPKATFSIGEHVTRRVKQIEQIINTKFKKAVKGLYCLPIIYNPEQLLLTVDYDESGAALKPIKLQTGDGSSESINDLKEALHILVEETNKNIDEYNTIAEEARRYSDLYPALSRIEEYVFESVQEYKDYFNTIHASYDTLQDRIDEMRTLIQQQSNLYEDVWQQLIKTETNQNPPLYKVQLDVLKDACSNLDLLINELPELPITTNVERNNVLAFIDGLFKAQIALDDLLNSEDVNYLDIRAEQELISSAIEKLVQNQNIYGKPAVFAKRWWATLFTIGVRANDTETVKTENDMFFGYINRINSWIDTLQNHVLQELQDNYELLKWYSSLLNNYFSSLLNSAETFANTVLQDAAQKLSIINSVTKGRGLIEQFNAIWDTRPDETYNGPSFSPEVDKINRMPVKWKDLYGFSDSIMPSFNEMQDYNGIGRFYYYLSTSPWFLDKSKTKMILSQRKDGKLLLYIQGPTLDGTTRNVTLTFENDITKAKPKDVERWQYVNIARLKFIRKAIAALKFVKENPGYEIRFDAKTNKGLISYNENGDISPITNWAFAGELNSHNLYTIRLSKEDRVGILVRLEGDNASPNTYNVKGGDNLTDDIGGFDRDYQKQKVHINSGSLVYFYNTGNDQYIGIPVQSCPIGKESAAKLVDLIQKYIAGDRLDQYGYNIMDLLRMRLYIADPERRISRRNNINNMVSIENGHVRIGNQTFDIVSNRQDLINKIASMNNVVRADMLNQYMRSSTNSIFLMVRTLFGNSSYTKVQLTNGLVFDKDDFIHHNDGVGVQDGSTWLGYMFRNNLIGTSAEKLGYKELRLYNLRVVPKNFLEEKTISLEIKQATKRKIVVKDDNFFDKLAGLKKIAGESEFDTNRSVEQQELFTQDVISYFDSVLGINGKVEFSPTDKVFLGQISRNERIAGICTTETIKLSRYVPMSVAWHEAFHKIFELVIPANERDKFYKAYRWGRITEQSDRVVAEAFADMFVAYMENKQAINKADGFFKKIKPWIKSFGFGIGMVFKIGTHRAKQMFNLYNSINKGEYKNSNITKEQNDRFKKLFGEGLYYTVTNTDNKHSAEFSHISDIGDRDKLVRGLSYFILRAFGVDELDPNVAKVKITGGTSTMKSTVDRLAEINDGSVIEYLKNQHPVFEEVFEKVEKQHTTKDGKVVTYNYYPKFDALSRHIADYISSIFDTMRKPKIEEDDTRTEQDSQDDTGEAQDFKSSDTDHWDKAAYEFSKLDGMMDEVKLFFGTIPYGVYQDEIDEDGNVIRTVVTDYNRNKYGCPEFRPAEEVWSLMVNKFHTASDIEELDQMLEQYASVNEVYAQVYAKFHRLVDGIYKKNLSGAVILAQTNFDKEQLAVQILDAIQSQKNIFLVALSEKLDKNGEGGKSIRVVESSMNRDQRLYPDQWNRYLVSGLVGVFQKERGEGFVLDAQGRKKKTVLLFREGMGGTDGNDIFSRTAKFFGDLRAAVSLNDSLITVDGVKYDLNVFDDVNRIKNEIIHKLNTIGIMFERDALDYMLSELYGGVDIEAVRLFLNDTPASDDKNVIESEKKSTILAFLNKINSYVSDKGVINQRVIEEEGYGKIGFVNKLANWQGKYKRMSSQNMAYALNGKKLYSISQNNTISHIVKLLNTIDDENETIKVLSNFGYNISRDELGAPIGSIILKAIANKQAFNINTYTYIGFKTDNKGDQGSEYTDASTIEDYLAKMTMLQQGYLIFPTLADKGTWMVMDGVLIPGMKFITLSLNEGADIQQNGIQQMVVNNPPTVRIINGMPYLIPDNSVVDQMIEYAKTEMLGIQQCMENLGYEDIPGYQKTGRKVLSESEKIVNYHTPNVVDKKTKKTVEPNGTRFLSLTAVTTLEYNPETKKYELVTHNLNDPREDSITLLKRAQQHFFARREGESVEQMVARQRETMALTLAVQTQNEVNTAVQLGIVQKVDYQATFGNNKVYVSSKDENLINLDTNDLNSLQIQTLLLHIMNTTKTSGDVLWKDVKTNEQLQFYSKVAKSLAIAAILQDATNRHIICSQEVQRCFSGHPALFKVKYGKTGILDSAFDIQKRIGGLVSTGEDNITTLPGIKKKYVCAECNDYEVKSLSNIAYRLESMFSESNARYTYGCVTGNWDDAYLKSIDKIVEECEPAKAAYERGKQYAKSFTGGINVADGASYITADMCRDMLRMRGAYNNKVRKAFKILMSSTKYDWINIQDAYETVYGALNIVPTKYTAYGFREHMFNGNNVSDVAVAYYNKFALFPIFPCMATGNMEGVYNKMLDELVDMLLMTSAVKLGSQGAVSYDGNTIGETFNKYEQDYLYLRRQLNTDPEDKDETHIGTQMIKIGLSNLVSDRLYRDLDGNEIRGSAILDQMMSSINSLADIGAQEIRDMFLVTDTETDKDGNIVSSIQRVDYQKMSLYLNEQLTSRNANKTIIQAILTTADGKKLMSPLAATPDAAWIESIFISTMNKHIVDITTPGKSFVQRSVWAMEGDSNMAKSLNRGLKLQMINEDHSMDAVISIDYFKDILPKDLSFEQSKQWLIDNGIISGYRYDDYDMSQKWFDAEAIMIGYRIPTQAQSSIHALRIVDVLPATKTTIILPEEFTKITGSDKNINVRTLKNFFNCWKPLTSRRGQSAAKTLRYYVSRVRFND